METYEDIQDGCRYIYNVNWNDRELLKNYDLNLSINDANPKQIFEELCEFREDTHPIDHEDFLDNVFVRRRVRTNIRYLRYYIAKNVA